MAVAVNKTQFNFALLSPEPPACRVGNPVRLSPSLLHQTENAWPADGPAAEDLYSRRRAGREPRDRDGGGEAAGLSVGQARRAMSASHDGRDDGEP